MPDVVDDLRIKINADAQKANNAIDVLVGKLDILTTSLGKIDGSKLTGLANGVSAFGNAVKLVGSVDKRNFDRLATNITKIASIDTASINRAASSMNQLKSGLNALGSVSQNAVQISEVAANISKLGGKNVTNAITNLPLLTTELNKFMSVMANSPQVSKNIIDMTNALANLAGQGRSVGAATNTLTNGLNKSDRTITRTSKSTLSLAAAFGKFYATYFLVLRGIKGLWSSIERTADYFEAFNYFNVAFNKIANEWKGDWEKYGKELGITTAKAYAESFTDRMEDTFSKLSGIEFNTETGLLSETGTKNLGMNIQQITQYASQLASVTNSLGLTGEASLATSSALTKLAGDMSSLFNIDYEQVSQNLTSGLLNSSRALYKYGIDVTSATLQTKAYELGLTKAVSEMEQYEKFQLKLLSVLEQSKVAWGDQANTINSLANQIRVLKNGWSEVGMVFGQLFVPMLEDALPVINGMVIALKRLLINLAGFMGVKIDPNKFNTGLNDNEEILDGITDGFEDATAAAKEYENQVFDFDEIRKYQDTTATLGFNTDGSGIDLTQEILDATSEYEGVWNEAYANMENRAEEWANVIASTFSNAKIVKAFNELSNAIQNMGKALKPFGKGFGDGFVGFFDALVNDIGGTVIKYLADDINNFAEVIKLMPDDKLEAFGNALGKMAAVFLTFKVGSAAFTAMKGTYDLLAKYKTLGKIAVTVTIALESYNVGTKINQIVMDTEDDLNASIGSLLDNVIWSVRNGTFVDDLVKSLFDIKAKHQEDVNDMFKILGQSAWNGISPWFTKEKWKNLFNDVKGGMILGWSNVETWWKTNGVVSWASKYVSPYFKKSKWTFSGIKDGLSESWNSAVNWVKNAFNTWFTGNPSQWFSKNKWTFNGIKDGLKTAFENAIESLKNIWSEFAEWLNKKLEIEIPTIDVFGGTFYKGITMSLGKLPTYATGGFPEDGLFMANHNELVGQFANGKTAVANNEQIIEGIKQGVYEAVVSAMSNTSSESNGDVIVSIDGKHVFRAVRKQAQNYTRQTGSPAF